MHRFLLAIFFLSSTGAVSFLSSIEAQLATPQLIDEVRVNGLVLGVRKYSFTLQSIDKIHNVQIPNGTPMLLKLNKPEFDLDKRTVSFSLMLSAEDGEDANNEVVIWKLPEPTFVTTTFRNEAEKEKVLAQSVRFLDRFTISDRPLERTDLSFGGELKKSPTPGQFLLAENGGVYAIELGKRRGLLAGFSIMDLIPMQTSVWVQGSVEGDSIVASRIRFEYLGDATGGFDPSLPNVLSLGDVTSYDYQRPLIEALRGRANVHHPPTWTGASSNWKRLHHYVGQLDQTKPTWDIIALNFGIRDDTQTREEYQENLRNAIRLLNRTGAKLIWVNSTPIPNGYPAGQADQPLTGRVRGRMELQNHWAAVVMAEFPNVKISDVWQVVKDGRKERYKNWWRGDSISFDYLESIPLGRCVGESVLQTLGRSGELNPMSVHGTKTPLSSSR
ncbi:MAG: hypothetical protein P8J33_16530 [Pirellulaceae bacterium]|nr:hypothetical protein [Pirellulaceae bacterium]